MSSFTEPLYLTPDGGKWKVTRTFSYEIGKEGSGLRIIIPEGYRTDLGSIPRILWLILAPHDPYAAAPYTLHDCLYDEPEFSRLMADFILYESLRVNGYSRLKSALIFLGARIGGKAYHNIVQGK
jgi:hypothetical protein